MADIVIDVEIRDVEKEKNNREIRRQGLVPVVVYGQGKVNEHLKLNQKDFLRKLKNNFAHNIFIDLKLKDKSDVFKTVLIKDVQKSWRSHAIEHIDFIEIDPNHKIYIEVPVILEGDAEGVTQGGILQFVLREIEVYCLPKNTPKNIKLNVSSLKIGDSIHASDINLGEDVKVSSPSDTVIVSIVNPEKPRASEVAAEAAAAAATAAGTSTPAAGATAQSAPAKKEAKK